MEKIKKFNYEDIFDTISLIPQVGILIYREKILYANKSALNLLGYTLEEIQNYSVLQLVHEKYRKIAEKNFQKRLKGKNFFHNYYELKVRRKDGTLLTCLMFTSTIEYDGKPAGFVIAIDISQQKFLEKAYFLIANINKIINTIEEENKFILEVCKELNNTYENHDIIITEIKHNNNKISYKFYRQNILKNKKILEVCDVCLQDKKIISQLNQNKIIFLSDLKKHFKKLSIPNLKSISIIPIFVQNELKYIVKIFSYISEHFGDNETTLLKQFQESLSFGIEKLEMNKNIEILYKALENSPDWVLITKKDGTIIYVNKTVEKLTGYSKEELIGNTPKLLKSGFYGEDFYKKMWDTLLSGNPFSCVIINKNKSGNFFKVEHLIIPVKINEKVSYFVALGKDLSREEKLEGEVYKLKFHDFLTGILNRYGFIFEIDRKIISINKKRISSPNIVGLLILIDIYNFSAINKIFSEKVGDEILTEVAKLLENIIHTGFVARTGGDEFSVFIEIEEDKILNYLDSLINLFKLSKFSSKNISVDINIGAAIYPKDAKSTSELINNAKTSVNIAKKQGENKYAIFNKELEQTILNQRETKILIKNAFDENWFEVFLQPYFYIKDSSLAGFEALLRINHPSKGIITPYYFIDALEDSEYIFDVEKLIIQKISYTIQKWHKKGINVKPISLNLSVKSFENKDVISFLINEVNKLKKPLINVEITERLLLVDPEKSKETIMKLQSNGIKISLDDFGTGYSSLSYLAEIPVNYIKIDISFIKKFLTDSKAYSIVETIIALSKKLKVETIAEGIETQEQLNELKKLKCDIAQGFLFSKPIPISEAKKFLLKN